MNEAATERAKIYLEEMSGLPIPILDYLALLPPDEGQLTQYYGRIGNGKTYAATCDVIDLLNRGQVVYTNWPILWEGRDERKIWWCQILGRLGIKKKFWVYPKENLRRINIDGNFFEFFKTLTSCHIFIDEGHIAFDSYKLTKMPMEDRVAVLSTRHFDRSVHIISQRPTAIHVVLRANVNRFYKCELRWKFLKFRRFMRTEFQDTKDDIPDEAREVIVNPETGERTEGEYLYAVSEKRYWGRKKIFASYDTKFLRGGQKESQDNAVKIYEIKPKEWWRLPKKKIHPNMVTVPPPIHFWTSWKQKKSTKPIPLAVTRASEEALK